MHLDHPLPERAANARWEVPVPAVTPSPVTADVVVDDFFAAPIRALHEAVATFGVELDLACERSPLTAVRLEAIVAPYAERLRELDELHVFGAGFIPARGAFGAGAGSLAWWKGPGWRRLALAAGAVSKEHIDYTALEWFRVPAVTGRPHIVGPYVDYLCNDEYTVTIAVPVLVERGFVGVLALDVLVDSIERDLLPRLEPYGDDLVVVNRHGRVLVSTSPDFEAGDALRGAPPTAAIDLRAALAGVEAGDDRWFSVVRSAA